MMWSTTFPSNFCFVFFFKQKTAYEIVSRDWSSDVCSSDLGIDFEINKMAVAKLMDDFI